MKNNKTQLNSTFFFCSLSLPIPTHFLDEFEKKKRIQSRENYIKTNVDYAMDFDLETLSRFRIDRICYKCVFERKPYQIGEIQSKWASIVSKKKKSFEEKMESLEILLTRDAPINRFFDLNIFTGEKFFSRFSKVN